MGDRLKLSNCHIEYVGYLRRNGEDLDDEGN